MAMGKRFADDAGVTEQVGWDDESVERLLNQLIEVDGGILIIGDRSMIGGLVYPHPFNNERIVFQELFWRSEGRGGMKLLAAAEQRARELGASKSIMLGMTSLPRLDRLYAAKGYAPMEQSYIKGL